MPGKRPIRRTVHVGFRLTKAEARQLDLCRQKLESRGEAARRLMLYVASPPLNVQHVFDASSGGVKINFTPRSLSEGPTDGK